MKVQVLVEGSGRFDVLCPDGARYGGRLVADVHDRADPRYGRALLGRFSREQLPRRVQEALREKSRSNGLRGGYIVGIEIQE